MPGRLEPLHPSLALTGGLMGVFGAIIQIAVLPMLHVGQELPFGCPIAGEFVGNEHPRHVGESFKQLAEEPLGGFRVPVTLDQDIEDMAILVHGSPQIVALTVNAQKHFIQMPFIARPRASTPQLVGIGLPELPAPIPHGFVGQGDTAFAHQLLHVAIAEAEAEIEPHAVADDLCRKAVAFVGISSKSCSHAASMPHKAGGEEVADLI